MDLLDRYLQAVKKHLPWKRQDDLIAELRANLESQLEDKEAELGRPLTNAEAVAWLRQLGSPMDVAARYQLQQYVIGPGLFPAYWYVLRLACGWALVVFAILSAVQIATGTPSVSNVLAAIFRGPGLLLSTAAWVTLIFAVLEFLVARGHVKLPSLPIPNANWDPANLPAIEPNLPGGKKPRSYAQATAEAVFGFLALSWLLLIPQYPELLLGPGAYYVQSLPYRLAPVWMQFYWWIIVLNFIQVAWRSIDLWRGAWQRPPAFQHIVFKIFGIVPLVLLILAPARIYLMLKPGLADPGHEAVSLPTINNGIHTALLIVCAIASVQLIWDIWKASTQAYQKRLV